MASPRHLEYRLHAGAQLPNEPPELLDNLVRINNAAVPAVDEHSTESLALLLAMAKFHITVTHRDELGALLVAFAPKAAYLSRNYRWFSERFENFVYIDRIVVDERLRGAGIGKQLYSRAAETASELGSDFLLAEVNTIPLNQASLDFHAAVGFSIIAQVEHQPGYSVAMLSHDLRS